MTDVSEITKTVEEFRGKDKTYAELIAELFNDKFVEIYLGDSYEEISVEQISSSYPAVFCGKVVGAFKECLIIKAIHVTRHKMVEEGNVIFINERAIRGLSEVVSHCSLQDMILRSNEVFSVYDAFINRSKVKVRR